MSIAPHPIEPAADDALARDSDLLSAVLHDVLVEQCGGRFADTVRRMHEAAAALRDGEAGADAVLSRARHGPARRGHRALHPRLRAPAPAREHRRGARARPPPAPLRRDRRAPARVADGGRRAAARGGARPRRRAAHAARRARPHRPPDRGDAPLRARPPARPRAAARPARRPADRPLAAAHARVRAARGDHHLVADRRGPPHPPDGGGRGPAQPVLLRGDAARGGPGGPRGARAPLRGARARARAVVRVVGRIRHGRPSRGRGGDARADADPAPPVRRPAPAREGRPARAAVLPLEPPDARLPRARGVDRARRRRAPVGARAAAREPRLRAAADQARLHHPPAREHARPADARARLRRPAGAARRPLAGDGVRRLRPRRARQPAPADVAHRRVRLPRREPRRAPVGVGRPGGGRGAAAGLRRRGRGHARRAARAGDRRRPPRAPVAPRTAPRASCCGCSRPSCSRASGTAAARCR